MAEDMTGWVEWKQDWHTPTPQWQPLVDVNVFIFVEVRTFGKIIAADEELEYENGLPEDVSPFIRDFAIGRPDPTWLSLAQLQPHLELLQHESPGWQELYDFMVHAAHRLVGNIFLPDKGHLLTFTEACDCVRLVLWM